MTNADLEQTIETLRTKRAHYETEHRQRIEKLDAAISALQALIEESPIEAIVSVDASDDRRSYVRSLQRNGRGVRSKVVDLLTEHPERDWSVGEIIDEYDRRQEPFPGERKKVDPQIRAALVVAGKRDEVVRTTPGRYRAATSEHESLLNTVEVR